MAWVLLIIVLGLAVGLAIVTFGLNRLVLAGLVALLVAIASLIYYTEVQDSQRASLFEPDQVTLTEFNMENVYGRSYALRARVSNASREHTLTAFRVSAMAKDCTEQGSDPSECIVVGDQAKEVQLEVPPGQARDFYQQFEFPHMRPRGELRWDFAIEQARGF